MADEMITMPEKEFYELLYMARMLRDMTERLSKERDDLKKDLTITKAQLEESWEQIK